jgi:LacI family transcriptional regulator
MPASRPTIADVARISKVSIATVSRVLNGTAPVDEETAARVRATIETLSYVPQAAARILANRRTDTIGMVLPEIGGAFFQHLLQGVETGASEAGYDLLIHTTRNPHKLGTSRRSPAEHNTDGLLVFTNSLDTRELTRLYKAGFPVILLHQTPPKDIELPIVTVENQHGARIIVEHLIKVHNRRRIAYLQGIENHEDSEWREKGYLEALKANGLPFDPQLVRRGMFDRNIAKLVTEEMLADNIHFDAVFAADDDSAVGVLLALRQAGCRVPEDIAVVGFDDQAYASSLIPPLTTIHAPTEQVGLEAVRQLVRVIHGEEAESLILMPVELVIRNSCGCQA